MEVVDEKMVKEENMASNDVGGHERKSLMGAGFAGKHLWRRSRGG